MKSIGSSMKKIADWSSTGSGTQVMIRRILILTAGILIVYHLGYALGKLIFRIAA